MRKPFIATITLLAVALVAAACGGAATPTPECLEPQDGALVPAECGDANGLPTATPTPTTDNGNGGPVDAVSIIQANGCGSCHTISSVPGAAGQVGPNLSAIGSAHDAAYIYESIVNPGAVIAADCPTGPCPAGVMPNAYGRLLTEQQLGAVVEFLAGLK
jgi:hypothetical protein